MFWWKVIWLFKNLRYSNIVFAGTVKDRDYLTSNIDNLVIIENIINNKLHMVEEPLKRVFNKPLSSWYYG